MESCEKHTSYNLVNIYGIKILTVVMKQKSKNWIEELNCHYKISKLSAAVKSS
jgi:hypothetical protein